MKVTPTFSPFTAVIELSTESFAPVSDTVLDDAGPAPGAVDRHHVSAIASLEHDPPRLALLHVDLSTPAQSILSRSKGYDDRNLKCSNAS